MATIGPISDTRIKVRASKQLLQLLVQYQKYLIEIPESIANILRVSDGSMPSRIKLLKNQELYKTPLDIKQLQSILTYAGNTENESMVSSTDIQLKREENYIGDESSLPVIYLYLTDLKWLNSFLNQLRQSEGVNLYLNDILEKCKLDLPHNDIIQRNPELEARCRRLREEQENREYIKMTKDVNPLLKNYPEDTIAYQVKALNTQIVAVLQFIFSVAAGFAFGFFGLEFIIGTMDFGFRLLLGIIFALIVALAEMYFLAKKLNEYDTAMDTVSEQSRSKISLKDNIEDSKKDI